MYVGRIPLPLFAALAVSTGLALIWIGIDSMRGRVREVVPRCLLAGAAAVAAMLSPFVVHAMAGKELARIARLEVSPRYSPYIYAAPAFVVAVLFAISQLLFSRPARPRTSRWHHTFWLSAFVFALLNVTNWCSPGWCERFGFPFSYSWWSDAIIIWNGENLTAGTSLVALGANILAFVFFVAALGWSYRRSAVANVPTDDARSASSDSPPTP
jgi:hypothetical protein